MLKLFLNGVLAFTKYRTDPFNAATLVLFGSLETKQYF